MKIIHLQPFYFIVALVALVLVCSFVANRVIKHLSEKEPALTTVSVSALDDSIRDNLSMVLFIKSKSELCDYMKVRMSKLKADLQSQDIHFYQVNIAENDSLVNEYNITLLPMVLIFKHGQEQQRIMGMVPSSNLEMIRDRLLLEKKY